MYWILIITLACVNHAAGSYELEIRLNAYSNPTGRCVECRSDVDPGPGCCDEPNDIRPLNQSCPTSNTCDTFLLYCMLALGSNNSCCPRDVSIVTPVAFIDTNQVTFEDTFFNQENPILFLSDQPWEGVLFLVEAGDTNMMLPADLIDTFFIDINITAGTASPQLTFSGNASISELDLNFAVRCARDYYGQDCATFCPDFQSCSGCGLPGFAGEFCQLDVSANCADVTCTNGNGVCVAEIDGFVCECNSSFTGELCENAIPSCANVLTCPENSDCINTISGYVCVCQPGYTGGECEVNIDDCQSVNCSSNGVCVDRVNSFECACDEGFTGRFCEENLAALASNDLPINVIIGVIVGGVLFATIFFILLLVFAIVMLKQRKAKRVANSKGNTSSAILPGDNPVYEPSGSQVTSSGNPQERQEQLNSGAEGSSEMWEFDNPIYAMDSNSDRHSSSCCSEQPPRSIYDI